MLSFALVDCNNFYASCERAFNPKLNGRPIIVLSNNDGCVVARSNEAKALGIPMAIPFFKIQDLVQQHKVAVFSSNYTLYGDMSARVMSVLAEFTPELEVYSIDESFLNVNGFDNLLAYGMKIRRTVKQWVGIPTSVGIGPTKTIAKLANHLAKRFTPSGVFDLSDAAVRQAFYGKINVNEVWGVGAKLSQRLHSLGIETVQDLVQAEPALIQQRFSVVLAKTQKELQGISCLELTDIEQDPKSMVSSRSFGKSVTDINELKAAITWHVSRLGEKLRARDLAVKSLCIFAHTNRFSKNDSYKDHNIIVALPQPSNATASLLKVALDGVDSIFDPAAPYKKAGAYAYELYSTNKLTLDLFAATESSKAESQSRLLDSINARYGKHALFHGSLGTQRDWLPKHGFISQRYTTQIKELLVVK